MAATTNGTLSSSHANGTSTSNPKTAPQIHLYTNHRCPYAHRAHIVLEELKLPFEETIIDLDTPRPQWYLDINPRGKLPIFATHPETSTKSLPQASSPRSNTPSPASPTKKSSTNPASSANSSATHSPPTSSRNQHPIPKTR